MNHTRVTDTTTRVFPPNGVFLRGASNKTLEVEEWIQEPKPKQMCIRTPEFHIILGQSYQESEQPPLAAKHMLVGTESCTLDSGSAAEYQKSFEWMGFLRPYTDPTTHTNWEEEEPNHKRDPVPSFDSCCWLWTNGRGSSNTTHQRVLVGRGTAMVWFHTSMIHQTMCVLVGTHRVRSTAAAAVSHNTGRSVPPCGNPTNSWIHEKNHFVVVVREPSSP